MLLSYIIWSTSFICDTLMRGERTWSDYWNQFLDMIIYYPITSKEPPDTIRYCTAKARARKILLLLCLMATPPQIFKCTQHRPNWREEAKYEAEEKQRQVWHTENIQVDWLWTASSKICIGDYSLNSYQQGWHQAHHIGHWFLQKRYWF